MMVAYDSRRPPTPLSEATRSQLRAAMAESLDDSGEARPSLRAAVLAAAAEAREREMRPEELIIELKGLFTSALQGRATTFSGDEHKLREWMVTTCLKAYYSK